MLKGVKRFLWKCGVLLDYLSPNAWRNTQSCSIPHLLYTFYPRRLRRPDESSPLSGAGRKGKYLRVTHTNIKTTT